MTVFEAREEEEEVLVVVVKVPVSESEDQSASLLFWNGCVNTNYPGQVSRRE